MLNGERGRNAKTKCIGAASCHAFKDPRQRWHAAGRPARLTHVNALSAASALKDATLTGVYEPATLVRESRLYHLQCRTATCEVIGLDA